jgi:hypothetical protein
MIGATGPNGSSFSTRASPGTSVSTVGRKKKPALPWRSPPAATLAPFALASPTKVSIAATRRSFAIGPICEAASRPLPSFSPLAISVKRSVNFL